MEPKNILVEPLGSAEPRLKNTGVGIKFLQGIKDFLIISHGFVREVKKSFPLKCHLASNNFKGGG